MKTDRAVRFDEAVLRELAGDKVFARGAAYHRDDKVTLLAIDPGRVLARVAGTENYRTEVIGGGEEIGGGCSCPAFEDWGFCKHMVAAALAANAAAAGPEAPELGALARIRDHLKAKDIAVLVDLIVGIAEQDAALFRRLEMAAAVAYADDGALEARLGRAIDEATLTSGYITYRAAGNWAAEASAVLEVVADLIPAGRSQLAMTLVERAIDGIEETLEEIDDSDGHCTGLLERARDLHLRAARVARPAPVELARDLFDREMNSAHDTFHGAAWLYGDVLGEAGISEYRRLATEAWDRLPPCSGPAPPGDSHDYAYGRLQSVLEGFAENEADVDARVALRGKRLTSPWEYLRLAEFCAVHGREEEALRRCEEGLWLFEDGQPDQRLAVFAAGLLRKAHRLEDAQALLERTFRKAPSLELYEELRASGGEASRERALGFLQKRAAEEIPNRWRGRADLLVRVLMNEKAFGAAWQAVRTHGASGAIKNSLAQASEQTHPREAIEIYAERVAFLANSGGDHAYGEAAKLVARMAGLRSVSEQAAHVGALKMQFARKRNFIKLLG